MQELVDNYRENLKTSPAVQDEEFVTPPDPGPPMAPADLKELLRPRLGHEERITRLKALGYTSADYHCNGRVWIGAFFVTPENADRLILILEGAGLTEKWPRISDLALLGDCPYEDDHRTASGLLDAWEKRFAPPMTEPEYQI